MADLEAICAAAADEAKLQAPDLVWTDHGPTQQLTLGDLRLQITVWNDTDQDHDLAPLALAGEVDSSRPGSVRRAADVVCENQEGTLLWSLDTVTRNPMAGIVGDPQRLSRTAFFTYYPYLRPGIAHVLVRHREPLDEQTVVGLLVQMLKEAGERDTRRVIEPRDQCPEFAGRPTRPSRQTRSSSV